MDTIGLSWWRVVLGKGGNILTVERVEAAEKGSTRVYFVRAQTSDEARAEAYAKRLEICKASAKQRTDRLRAENKCLNCGQRPPRPGEVTLCQVCYDRKKKRSEVLASGGAPLRKTRLGPAAALANFRKQTRLNRRFTADLRHVWRQFKQLGPAKFEAWLSREIAMRDLRSVEDEPVAAE